MENLLLDRRLDVLRDKLLLLGGKTEEALDLAVRALTDRDNELAQKVKKGDKVIDEMELEIDRLSIDILALQQPAAHDLRFVISVAKITPLLERIADHAVSIAKAALVLNNEPQLKKLVNIPAMAKIAAEMLKDALDSFTTEDSVASREIIKRDKEIDKYYKLVFEDLLKIIIENPQATNGAAHLLFVAKHLERIGDYVKDICELNVYLREAAFIKHKKKE